jgi:hypothetical protein
MLSIKIKDGTHQYYHFVVLQEGLQYNLIGYSYVRHEYEKTRPPSTMVRKRRSFDTNGLLERISNFFPGATHGHFC